MPDAIARECERSKVNPDFRGDPHTLSNFAFSSVPAATIVSKYDVRERVAPDLLVGPTSPDPVNKFPPKEQWFVDLVPARVVREPVSRAPPMFGTDDVRMFDAVHCLTAFEEEMANNTPGRGSVELFKQGEQAVDDDLSFLQARCAKFRRAKEVERSPNQLEVEAYREDPGISVRRLEGSF